MRPASSLFGSFFILEIMLGPWGVVLMQLVICLLLLRSLIQLNAKRWKEKTKKTIIVLGSGGHTSEMFQFLKTLTGIEEERILIFLS